MSENFSTFAPDLKINIINNLKKFTIMKYNSYKHQLSKILSYIGQNYSLTDSQFEQFQNFASHYFRVIPPIVASDLEILLLAREFLNNIIDFNTIK